MGSGDVKVQLMHIKLQLSQLQRTVQESMHVMRECLRAGTGTGESLKGQKNVKPGNQEPTLEVAKDGMRESKNSLTGSGDMAGPVACSGVDVLQSILSHLSSEKLATFPAS